MILQVELEAEIFPGRKVNYVAHTNRLRFPTYAGTPIGEGPSAAEALAALGRELDRIARLEIIESDQLVETIKAEPLERLEDRS